MITALSISNFVLIDHLTLEASSGFTGLTGETGAGKSILLDALGMVLGTRPDKRFIRRQAQQATISVEFDLASGHDVWPALAGLGLAVGCEEPLVLKRVIPASGGARGYINDKPVSSAVLGDIGQYLIEIHSQHAASNLLKPSYHRDMLDKFAGNAELLEQHAKALQTLQELRAQRRALEARISTASEDRELLESMVADLDALSPEPGESRKLTIERAGRMQSERIVSVVSDALLSFEEGDVERVLASTSAALVKLCALPGFAEADLTTRGLPAALRLAGDAFERACIETQEAVSCLQTLSQLAETDDMALEKVETRLFALKAAARKYRVEPDNLGQKRQDLRAELALIDDGEAGLLEARARETDAAALWRSAADKLSQARITAARRLQRVVQTELGPLKLGDARIQFSVRQLEEGEADSRGNDAVEIEVETNSASGFGPLRKIASGGELARFSLALNCAVAEAGCGAPTLIFDEADQGVGGAVAAAIGDRLARLAHNRQVFAVTHSPQVAASAQTQWRIEKSSVKKSGKGLGQTQVRVLNAQTRLEEIARMLSGSSVTPEARAAASRLLEG